ncbi:hypothetical protein CARUB_v10015432mg, partial [Capsella rubella]
AFVLFRVPAKSLKRLGSTCKQWNALFENERFTKKHYCKAPKQSMILMLLNSKVCPMNVNLKVSTPSIEFKSALSLKNSNSNSKEVDITGVFHCDGLLLCFANDNKLVAWNPCLGETRWIQLKTDYKKGSMKSNKPFVEFEIYEFSSDSWKVFDKFSLEFIKPVHNGLSFNFTTERFKRLCLPPIQDSDWIVLSLAREEQLSVLYSNYHTSNIDVWIANSIDDTRATLSWRKSFTVELKVPAISVFISVKSPSFLIDEDKKVVVCCDSSHYMVNVIGEDNTYYTEHPLVPSQGPLLWYPCIFSYVPSLVRIQRSKG